MRKKNIKILILVIVLLFVINYAFLDNYLEKFFTETETIIVERVIDGDTIKAENKNESVRLLGINTPERGEFYYE